MIEGANCYECGRCNGGDMCRNGDNYPTDTQPKIRKEQAASWLIHDAGSIALHVSDKESSATIAIGVKAASDFVVTLIKNIERSYEMTRAAKLRLLEHLTTILREEE